MTVRTLHLLAAASTAALLACPACGGETVDVGSGGSSSNNDAANDDDAANNDDAASNNDDAANNDDVANNDVANNDTANNDTVNNDTAASNNDATSNNGGTCVDADQDGAPQMTADCTAGPFDCADDSDWIFPGADDVCGDNLDENCDPEDDVCPTTQTSDVDVPTWNCVDGDAPDNVIAWAHFGSGRGYFEADACFVVFEGIQDEFYVTKHLSRADAPDGCADSVNGCTCPSEGGWPSYDRRLYAFLLQGTPSDCEPISIRDHGGEDQVVSNACRKYFYQLHWPGHEIPFSYVATGEDTVRERLAAFPTLEIACAEDAPHNNLPFSSLLTAEFQFNEGFVKR